MSIIQILKSHPYQKWEAGPLHPKHQKLVTYRGKGYVLIGNIRYDDYDFLYKEERELWNSLKSSFKILDTVKKHKRRSTFISIHN